jgi:hypothetical protein
MRRTMTHDELLLKIDAEIEYNLNEGGVEAGLGNALRAVVELHKPIIYPQTTGLPSECTVCRAEPYYSSNEVYPCLTIQAIEKELS